MRTKHPARNPYSLLAGPRSFGKKVYKSEKNTFSKSEDQRFGVTIYSDEESDWLKAMDQIRRRHGRLEANDPFILKIAHALGYRKSENSANPIDDNPSQ